MSPGGVCPTIKDGEADGVGAGVGVGVVPPPHKQFEALGQSALRQNPWEQNNPPWQLEFDPHVPLQLFGTPGVPNN